MRTDALQLVNPENRHPARLTRWLAAALAAAFALTAGDAVARPTDIVSRGEASLAFANLLAQELVALPDGRFAAIARADPLNDPSAPNYLVVALFRENLDLDTSVSQGAPGMIIVQPFGLFQDLPDLQPRITRIEPNSAAYHVRDGVPGLLVGLSVEALDTASGLPRNFSFVVRIPFSGVAIGNLDPGFGTSGFVRFEENIARAVRGVVVTADQSIYVARSLYEFGIGGGGTILINRLNPDGTPDTQWDSDGQLFTPLPLEQPAYRLEAQADQGVVVTGWARGSTGFERDITLSRFDRTGTLVPTFGTDGTTRLSRAGGTLDYNDSARDPLGRLLVSGTERNSSDNANFIARLNADGTLDTSFGGRRFAVPPGPGQVSVDGFIRFFEGFCRIAVEPSGRVIMINPRAGSLALIALRPDTLDFDTSFTRDDITGTVQLESLFPPDPTDSYGGCAGLHLRADRGLVLATTYLRNGVTSGPNASVQLIRLEGGDLPPIDDPARIDFESGSYTVAENAGTVRINVLRTVNLANEVSVRYRTVAGTATAGVDYEAAEGTLTFVSGQSQAEIDVAIIDDAIFEGATAEIFTVELFDVTGRAELGSAGEPVISAEVAIQDNETAGPLAAVGFNPVSYTVREDEGSVLLTVTRAPSLNDPTEVRFETVAGTAIENVDYTRTTGSVNFSAAQRSATIQVAIRNNSQPGQPRDFSVVLLPGASGASVIDPGRDRATVTILEDELSLAVADSVGDPSDRRIDFGAVEYDSVNEGVLTLRNTSTFSLSFAQRPSLVASSSDKLTQVANTCGVTLPADVECQIRVRYAPGSEIGSVTGEIRAEPQSGPDPIVVTVSGSAPPQANLFLTFEEAEPVNPEPGGSVQFRMVAGNGGPASSESSVVTIALPTGLTVAPGTLAPSQGTVSSDASSITWEIGPLGPATSDPTTRARLTWSANVDAAIARGSELTVSASHQLTDPRRVDPTPDNDQTFILAIGVAAADLGIVDVAFSRGQISIARLCTGGLINPTTCRGPDGALGDGEMTVTISNNGPDAASGPIFLRVTSGLCFDHPVWIPEDTSGLRFRARCASGPPFMIALAATSLPAGATVRRSVLFWAPSGPTGPQRPTIEVVHGTFDPQPDNNALSVGPVMVVIPLSDESGAQGMCFIATAAYGSWLDPHVATLRAFRDERLLTNAPGRAFVAWYYRVSPPLADWIAEREWARAAARGALAPVVFTVEHPGPAGVMALLMLGGLWRIRKRSQPPAEVTP